MQPEGQSTTEPRRSPVVITDELIAGAKEGTPDPAEFGEQLSEFNRRMAIDVTKAIREQFAESAIAASTYMARSIWSKPLVSRYDFSSVLAGGVFAEMRESLAKIGDAISRKLPPNWPSGIDWEAVVTVIQDDGIPLVWVPRGEIVEAVVAAPDRNDRIKIILNHSTDIADDCREALAQVADPALVGQVALAKSAVEAFAAGHHHSAQALAVVVTETALAATIDRSYKSVKDQVAVTDAGELTIAELRLRAALAPVGPFYTPWWPSSGTPAPEGLSRHVSVHRADPRHYTSANAHLSIMLAASVLPALAEYRELSARVGPTVSTSEKV